jgi:hypothetical protein
MFMGVTGRHAHPQLKEKAGQAPTQSPYQRSRAQIMLAAEASALRESLDRWKGGVSINCGDSLLRVLCVAAAINSYRRMNSPINPYT